MASNPSPAEAPAQGGALVTAVADDAPSGSPSAAQAASGATAAAGVPRRVARVRPTKMNAAEVTAALAPSLAAKGWVAQAEPERPCIKKTFTFRNFHQAWAFMSGCVDHANEADHHPEWFNVYNKVEVTLITHECNGVSQKDIDLANVMEVSCTQARK